MEHKIKRIQQYFKDQIFAWNFTYSVKWDEVSILIDTKYNFKFFVASHLAFQNIFWLPEEQFMFLDVTLKEEYKFWEIFKEFIVKNKEFEEREKDLKELKRLKELYE